MVGVKVIQGNRKKEVIILIPLRKLKSTGL